MIFLENATTEEKMIGWRRIVEISDADFGFNEPKEKTNKTRFCVRILLENERGEFCVVKSEKHGYFQLPGGGIEENESIMEALKRETEEETGWLIKDIQPIGYTLENREDARNAHDWDRSVSFAFSAAPDKQVGVKYTEDELAEGFTPAWMKLNDIIAELEKSEGYIESYGGCFSNRRDLSIAKFLRENKTP